MNLTEIDWNVVSHHLILLGTAYVLALPSGWNRERHSRSAGLRTFPLVALATCGFMLVGIEVLDSTDAEGRAIQGIITGMGFIGGGAILKGSESVTGTATAAALWSTGAIGLAVAFQRFEIALLISILNFCTLQFMPAVKPLVDEESSDRKDD